MKRTISLFITASLVIAPLDITSAGKLDDIQDQLDDMEYMNALRQLQEAQRRALETQRGQVPARPSRWQEITKDTSGTSYAINTESIKKLPNGNIAFEYHSLGDVPRYFNSVTYFSSIRANEINCRARTFRGIREMFFTKTHQSAGSVNYSPQFQPIQPNSTTAAFADYLCR